MENLVSATSSIPFDLLAVAHRCNRLQIIMLAWVIVKGGVSAFRRGFPPIRDPKPLTDAPHCGKINVIGPIQPVSLTETLPWQMQSQHSETSPTWRA
jgi:hypothetical protein